jgi:hypothetical protein
VTALDGKLKINLDYRRYNFWCEEMLSVVELALGPDGFTGKGDASVSRICADGNASSYSLAVTVAPRHTGPRFVFSPARVFAPFAVSWGAVQFWSDASIDTTVTPDNPDLDYLFGLQSLGEPVTNVPVTDANSMWPAVQLVDPDAFSGTRVRALLDSRVVDTFGNSATIDPSPIQFATNEVVSGVRDFDDGVTPKGLVGNAHYHPPDEPGSPCESGGCITIGPAPICPTHAQPTFFSMRLPFDYAIKLRLRMAIETSNPNPPSWPVLVDSLQYIRMALTGQVNALADPHDGLTHTTGFIDVNAGSQSNDPRGMAIGFECFYGYDDTIARVIVERIEVERDTTRD